MTKSKIDPFDAPANSGTWKPITGRDAWKHLRDLLSPDINILGDTYLEELDRIKKSEPVSWKTKIDRINLHIEYLRSMKEKIKNKHRDSIKEAAGDPMHKATAAIFAIDDAISRCEKEIECRYDTKSRNQNVSYNKPEALQKINYEILNKPQLKKALYILHTLEKINLPTEFSFSDFFGSNFVDYKTSQKRGFIDITFNGYFGLIAILRILNDNYGCELLKPKIKRKLIEKIFTVGGEKINTGSLATMNNEYRHQEKIIQSIEEIEDILNTITETD